MAGSVAFKGFDFIRNGEIDAERLNSQLYMLNERLDWMMSNLNANNFNRYFFDELTVRVAKGLNLEGVVTFKALAENDETVINGARIKTGVVEASSFITYTNSDTTETYGELLMYYTNNNDVTQDNPYLAGEIKMDDAGLGNPASSRYRLWLRTYNIPNSNFKVALKLESAYRASLEAQELIYIKAYTAGSNVGTITLEAEVINIKAKMILFNGNIIHEKE